jgi:hypothetical protein
MRLRYTLLLLVAAPLYAADNPDLVKVLARLDQLESENQKLLEELRALRQQITESQQQTPLAERVEVLEKRGEETDQTKVQASQRYPVSITGMALFNAFLNGKNNGGSENPLTASATPGPRTGGATLRQTIFGLRFHGPEAVAGARVSGSIDFDLWGGSTSSLNHLIRLRTATIQLDWTNTSVSVGQDKPLIAPRDPDSLSQVAFSPLTGAGNPWLWSPQVRVEQRFSFGEQAGVRLQGSLYQTREQYGTLPAQYQNSTEGARPGYEGRFQFWRKWGSGQRLELAPGFHASVSHVERTALSSNAFSFDWLVDPLPRWEITGAFYRGQNLSNIGGGGPGVSLMPNDTLVAVHQTSGWIQSTVKLTPRLKMNAFAGEQANRSSDLQPAAMRSNLAWGGNFMYRLAPNVIVSLEALQLRTRYLNSGVHLHDHYDLALAYLW